MIRAISNVTFVALALALWVCSMESARGAIYVDGHNGSDIYPGNVPNQPLKTISAAMQRILGTPSFPNGLNETTVYVRGRFNGEVIVYNESVVVSKSGTASNPVRLIGYTGPTPANGAAPEPSNVPLTLGDAEIRSQLYNQQAVLDGQDTRNIGIDFAGKQFVEVYNFDIRRFRTEGVKISGLNGKVKSVFLKDIGFDVSGIPGLGHGILVLNPTPSVPSNGLLQDIAVLNSKYAGIYLQNAQNCQVQSCSVYNTVIASGNLWAGTDYYFYLGTGKDCVLQNCKAERGFNATHEGHGFVIQAAKNVTEGTAQANCPGNDILNCKAINLGDAILLRGRTCLNTVDGFVATRLDDSHQHNYGHIRLESGPSNNEFRNVRSFNGRYGVYVTGWGEDHNEANCVGNKFINCLFETKDIAIYGYYSDTTDSPTELHGTHFVACTFRGRNPASGANATSSFQKMDRRPVGNVFTNCVAMDFEKLMPEDATANTYEHPDAPFIANSAPAGFTFNTCRFFSAGPHLSDTFFVGNILPGGATCLVLTATPYGYNAGYAGAPYYYFIPSGPLGAGGTTPPGIVVGHGHIGYFQLSSP